MAKRQIPFQSEPLREEHSCESDQSEDDENSPTCSTPKKLPKLDAHSPERSFATNQHSSETDQLSSGDEVQHTPEYQGINDPCTRGHSQESIPGYEKISPSDEEDVKKKLEKVLVKPELSLFKADNEKILKGTHSDLNEKKLAISIHNVLIRVEKTVHQVTKKIVCRPYSLLWYKRKTAETQDEQAKQHDDTLFGVLENPDIAAGEDDDVAKEHPGPRSPGNTLVFYRVVVRDGKREPDVFFLCDGSGYHSVRFLLDKFFTRKCAQHFLDENHIKAVKTHNIVGQSMTSEHVFPRSTNFAFLTRWCLDKYIVSVTGVVKENTALEPCLYPKVQLSTASTSQDSTTGKKRKGVKLTVSSNNVIFGKRRAYKEWSKLLEKISDDLSIDKKPLETDGLAVLDYIKRIDDVTELNKEMDRKIDQMILNKEGHLNYFPSHRFVETFHCSSSFSLYLKGSQGKMKSWYSLPSMQDIVDAIHSTEKLQGTRLKQSLEDRKIMLSFNKSDGKKESEDIHKFIHGKLRRKEACYYKIAQKWFLFSSTFFQNVDRNFAQLVKNLKFTEPEKKIETILYPWRLTEHCFTIEEAKGAFGFTDVDKLTKFMDILTEDIRVTDSDGNVFLTKESRMLPEASGISNFVKAAPKPKKNKFNSARKCLWESVENTDEHHVSESVKNTDKPHVSESVKNTDEPHVSESVENTDKPHVLFKASSKYFKTCSKELKTAKDEKTKIKWETEINKFSKICTLKEDKYKVINPVLTFQLEKTIQKEFKCDPTTVLNVLRSMMPLAEGEYNEMYLFKKHPDYVIIPGDKVVPNNIELFDILIHQKEQKITFLLHNKVGFKNTTRDACAQIRDSAQVLWHDFERGKTTHLDIFWKKATSKTATSQYRTLLKKKLAELGKQKFLDMFNDDVTVVFVLGFSVDSTEDSPKLEFDYKPLTADDFTDIEKDVNLHVFNTLTRGDFITKAGRFTEKMEKVRNLMEFSTADILKGLTQTEIKDTYNILTAQNPSQTDKPLSGKDFEGIGKNRNKDLFLNLQKADFVTETGFLTDTMVGITSAKTFVDECVKDEHLKTLQKTVMQEIYHTLRRKGKCEVSTIAKLELLSLDKDFANFQIGGRRKFELRLLQFNS